MCRALVFILLLMPKPLWAQALLQFDPFSRPTPTPEPVTRSVEDNKTAELQWSPQLIATVVAGPRSMANISGRLIRLGQTLQGFTLVAVDSKSATFERDGEQHVIRIKTRNYTR